MRKIDPITKSVVLLTILVLLVFYVRTLFY